MPVTNYQGACVVCVWVCVCDGDWRWYNLVQTSPEKFLLKIKWVNWIKVQNDNWFNVKWNQECVEVCSKKKYDSLNSSHSEEPKSIVAWRWRRWHALCNGIKKKKGIHNVTQFYDVIVAGIGNLTIWMIRLLCSIVAPRNKKGNKSERCDFSQRLIRENVHKFVIVLCVLLGQVLTVYIKCINSLVDMYMWLISHFHLSKTKHPKMHIKM